MLKNMRLKIIVIYLFIEGVSLVFSLKKMFKCLYPFKGLFKTQEPKKLSGVAKYD